MNSLTLFGSRHFDHYNWLLALTDRLGGIGLEHHRSSENDWKPNARPKKLHTEIERGRPKLRMKLRLLNVSF